MATRNHRGYDGADRPADRDSVNQPDETPVGADQRARTLLETYKEEAIRCLRDLENPNLKGLLRRVLGKIFNELEIKGWCKEFEAKNGVAQESSGINVPL